MRGVARINDTISHGGTIVEGSPDVTANGRRVARLGDKVECQQHGTQTITSASDDVRANGKKIARLNDTVSCGATITSASNNVFVN